MLKSYKFIRLNQTCRNCFVALNEEQKGEGERDGDIEKPHIVSYLCDWWLPRVLPRLITCEPGGRPTAIHENVSRKEGDFIRKYRNIGIFFIFYFPKYTELSHLA